MAFFMNGSSCSAVGDDVKPDSRLHVQVAGRGGGGVPRESDSIPSGGKPLETATSSWTIHAAPKNLGTVRDARCRWCGDAFEALSAGAPRTVSACLFSRV
jgi:hypothetical protein